MHWKAIWTSSSAPSETKKPGQFYWHCLCILLKDCERCPRRSQALPWLSGFDHPKQPNHRLIREGGCEAAREQPFSWTWLWVPEASWRMVTAWHQLLRDPKCPCISGFAPTAGDPVVPGQACLLHPDQGAGWLHQENEVQQDMHWFQQVAWSYKWSFFLLAWAQIFSLLVMVIQSSTNSQQPPDR